MFDIVSNSASLTLIKDFAEAVKVLEGVYHGSAAFLKAQLSDGSLLLAGSEVTGFSDAEEEAVGLVQEMPFLLETQLHKASGGMYERPSRTGVKRLLLEGMASQSRGRIQAVRRGLPRGCWKLLGLEL
jgi:putative intracellular protease/amidase